MFYDFIKLTVGSILKVFYRIKIYNTENIPEEGGFILCGNHVNNLDPILISIAVPRQISWMGKKELFNNVLLAWFLSKLGVFPVDRDGADINAIKKSIRILKSDNVLGIFPEGTRSKVEDINNAKSGVGLLAIKTKTPVLPIYIKSNYKLFRRVNIYIGKLTEYGDTDKKKYDSKDYMEISKDILNSIYNLNESGGR